MEVDNDPPAPSPTDGRRLMIREMVLDNFKSYAGPQNVGPFHKCFSSVVGPNGSGKSNVIDAMLFVFGRRAKQLRFNKVSELIHNSTNFRNLERATVTVYFQEIIDKEGDAFEVIPGSDFTVARTANRNNTSDYYVNGRKVSTKEVTSLLKGKGIDLDNNRFLILQGEVEQISLMKPKAEDKNDTGLLEYLEDIIGTDKYIEQIEAEGKRLEELNEVRATMITKLKAVEKEREGLEGRKLEAEAYLAKQSERLRASITGNKILLHQTQGQLGDIERKQQEFSDKLEHERKKFKTYEADLKQVEAEWAAADKAVAELQKSLDATNEEFKAFEHKDAKLRMDLQHQKAKQKKATAKAEEDKKAAQQLETDMAQWTKDVPAEQEAVAALTQQLAEAEAKLEELQEGIQGEVEGYHQQLSKVRGELAPWERQMQEVQSHMDVASSERDLLRKKATDAAARLEELRQQLAAAVAAVADKEAELGRNAKEVAATKQKAAEAQKQLQQSSDAEQQLEGQVRELRGRCAALRADAAGSATSSAAVKALLAAQQSGEIPGVLGRLGDLGAIDGKYDVAISTSCPSLDYIVVDTTADAQRCVELLRRRQLGVATFLILEKQGHLAGQMREKVAVPADSQRLFDLVRCKDERVKLAFWFGLRNTLVTADLDTASRIAYGTPFKKVVTLTGQLIAESGTMSGGGGRPRGGKIRLGSAAPAGVAADAKALEKELASAEKQLQQLEGQLRAARDARDAAERALAAADKQLQQLELAAPRAAQVAEAKRAAAADLQQRLTEAEASSGTSAEDEARLAELGGLISADTAQLAKLRASCMGLNKQAAALQAKIDGAGGEPLRRARDAVTKLGKKIADTQSSAAKKGAQLKAGGKQLDKLRKDAAKAEAEVERLAAAVATCRDAMTALEGEAAVVMTRQETLQGSMEEAAAALAAARQKKEDKEKEVGVIRSVEVEVEGALDKLRAGRKEAGSRLKDLTKKVEADTAALAKYTSDTAVEVPPEVLEGSPDEAFFQVTVLEEQLRGMSPDLGAIEAYAAKEAELDAKQGELGAFTTERDEVRGRYEGLRKARLDGFMSGFNTISLKLKEMYQMITLGGDAELELVDTLDPFSEGIVFSVRPPKKSWKHIANLSGGEKTLSSLSLVFALHHYKPTPLYVMDEIDAALDFKNVSIVGHYIKERTKNAQFVIISLRNNMFELADRLVGIYKTDNTTKTVTINPSSFVVGAPQQQQQQQAEEEQRQQQAMQIAVA